MKEVLFLIISLCVCLSSFYACEGKEAVNDEKSKQPVQSEDSVYSSEESIKKEDSSVLPEEKPSFTYEDAVAYFKNSDTSGLPTSDMGITMGVADFAKWLDGCSDLRYPTLDPNYDGTGDPHDHIIFENVHKNEEKEHLRYFCNDMKFYTIRLKDQNMHIHGSFRCDTPDVERLYSHVAIQHQLSFPELLAQIRYKFLYNGSSLDIRSMTVTAFMEDIYIPASVLDGDISDYVKETSDNTVPEESFHKARIYDQSKGEYVEIELVSVEYGGEVVYKFIYDKQIFSIYVGSENSDPGIFTDRLIIMDLLEEYEKIR